MNDEEKPIKVTTTQIMKNSVIGGKPVGKSAGNSLSSDEGNSQNGRPPRKDSQGGTGFSSQDTKKENELTEEGPDAKKEKTQEEDGPDYFEKANIPVLYFRVFNGIYNILRGNDDFDPNSIAQTNKLLTNELTKQGMSMGDANAMQGENAEQINKCYSSPQLYNNLQTYLGDESTISTNQSNDLSPQIYNKVLENNPSLKQEVQKQGEEQQEAQTGALQSSDEPKPPLNNSGTNKKLSSSDEPCPISIDNANSVKPPQTPSYAVVDKGQGV